MNRSTVAALAISALTDDRRMHLDIIAIMQAMKLSTDEAVATHAAIRAMWLQEVRGTDPDGARADRLGLAKTVTNQYARDFRLR